MCTDTLVVKDFGHSASFSQGFSSLQIDPKIMTDQQFVAFCGIQKNLFNFLLELAGTKIKDSSNIGQEGKLGLFLDKLKMNLTFSALSGMFKSG